MTLRPVGNRIAIDLSSLELSIPHKQILEILASKNIRPVPVNITRLSETLVGVARWKLPSRQWEAPFFFDCSSFTKWIYGQLGFWLPRTAVQQHKFCQIISDTICPGDLVFTSSPYKNGVFVGTDDGIGHVCLATHRDEVICATNSELGTGIICVSVDKLLETRKIRAIGRPVNNLNTLTTLIFPPEREVETSNCIRDIVLYSIK